MSSADWLLFLVFSVVIMLLALLFAVGPFAL